MRLLPRMALALAIALPVVVGVVATAAEREEQDRTPRVLWGIGDQLGPARESRFHREGTAGMVTAWFNGPGDLAWMRDAEPPAVRQVHAAGEAVQLIVWLADHPEYAVGEQFQRDVRTLVKLHEGDNGEPLYVVLFTEFETYADGDPGYRARLLEAYRKAVKVIHDEYGGARVALGFGGYAWDGTNPRDLTAYHDAIAVSDFTAVQQMQACDSKVDGRNIAVDKTRSSVRQLGGFGKPVMVSHFKLWGDRACQVSAFGEFAAEVFTESSLRALVQDGLFAWTFMADHYINDAGPGYDAAVARLRPHAAAPRPGAGGPTAGLPR
ncbi:hypothetical protein [Actinoplanes sp. URMC 104]|uniref:hypothetical protein n=1 Tax=Actinoplanes sp. URMC 104 TaxID=3423409 RepID=UPI003F1CF3FF